MFLERVCDFVLFLVFILNFLGFVSLTCPSVFEISCKGVLVFRLKGPKGGGEWEFSVSPTLAGVGSVGT